MPNTSIFTGLPQQNRAFNKTVFISSSAGPGFSSSLAVDGHIEPEMAMLFVDTTTISAEESHSWLMIDMWMVYAVCRIEIFWSNIMRYTSENLECYQSIMCSNSRQELLSD